MRDLMFVGGYTRQSPHVPQAAAEGIVAVTWDRQRQSFGVLGVTPGYDNPSWLAFDPMHQRLYAASEVAEWSEGLVVAYDVDVAHGKLAFAGLTASGGSSPCHIAIAADGTTLAVSNYGTASPGARGDHSLSLFSAATLRPLGAFAPPHRPSDNPRQERPHGHFAQFAEDGSTVWYADLGEDALFALSVDRPAAAAQRIELPAATGPRHFVRHPRTGDFFVVLELAGLAASIGAVGPSHLLELGGQPSGIRLSNDSRFLYVALRGLDEIAVLRIRNGRQLELIQRAGCGGTTPRDLVLATDGLTLLVANQDSNNLAAIPVDPSTGMLGPATEVLSLGSPTSIAIAGTVLE